MTEPDFQAILDRADRLVAEMNECTQRLQHAHAELLAKRTRVHGKPLPGEVWLIRGELWMVLMESSNKWVLLSGLNGINPGFTCSGWAPDPVKEIYAGSPKEAFERLAREGKA